LVLLSHATSHRFGAISRCIGEFLSSVIAAITAVTITIVTIVTIPTELCYLRP